MDDVSKIFSSFLKEVRLNLSCIKKNLIAFYNDKENIHKIKKINKHINIIKNSAKLLSIGPINNFILYFEYIFNELQSGQIDLDTACKDNLLSAIGKAEAYLFEAEKYTPSIVNKNISDADLVETNIIIYEKNNQCSVDNKTNNVINKNTSTKDYIACFKADKRAVMPRDIQNGFDQFYELDNDETAMEERTISDSLSDSTQVNSYVQSVNGDYTHNDPDDYNERRNKTEQLLSINEDQISEAINNSNCRLNAANESQYSESSQGSIECESEEKIKFSDEMTSFEDKHNYLIDDQPPDSDQLYPLVKMIDKKTESFDEHKLSDDDFFTKQQIQNNGSKYLIFYVGNTAYALSANNILEINRVSCITPVPNVPIWLSGVINVRGEIISAIDLRTYLGIENENQVATRRMIVVTIEKRKLTTCLLVDQISSFFNLGTIEVLTSHVALSKKIQPYLLNIGNYKNEIIAILDIEKFLLSSEIRQFQ